MNGPGHVMILASAGAGKTYALTTRFVRLLAAGADPTRVVALTFTRKAAGEFFDDILNRLAGAAADEATARKLGAEIERPDWSKDDFLHMLRAMIDAMPRLNLGTLDGFFSRMVQAFPLELGLSGEFTLLEEAEARAERQRVLGLIFAANAVTEAAQDDFIESFKRATFGLEEKALQRRLDGFLDEHGETFLSAPNAKAWGNAGRIWPQGCPWLEDVETMDAARERCRSELPWASFNDKQRDRMERFLGELGEWSPGAALPRDVEYVLKNALAVWDDLGLGGAEVMIERVRVPLGPAACAALRGIVNAIIAAELGRKLEITRGIHAVLRLYDLVYDRQVRRAGRLTFGDVQRVLQPVEQGDGGGGVSALKRQLIDWRLDARFDHWLLDEFQDTSRAQWSILKPLIDEAVQDPEGRRSFFYVGDVKQAIYGWRGGDARLFREIFDHYNEAQTGAIAEAHLQTSWRSGPAVIELVNAVFGDEPALREVVPTVTADRWLREWRAHKSARPKLEGCAELREAADEAGRFSETLHILQEIEPAKRGLTVAVLVQKNATGARLAEHLRAEGGLAAIAESDLKVAFDNPLTSALLALLRAAAHPLDGFAWGHIALTPVGTVIDELGWREGDRWLLEVLGEIDTLGYAETLARWLHRLESKLDVDDQFSRLRGRQLVEAARRFDEKGGGEVAAFLQWAESYSLRESDAPGVVRVMTVHKAKGLGFDVVIAPDLQGQSIDQRRRGLSVHRGEDHEVDWIMDPPSQLMTEHDIALGEMAEGERAESAYEALCRLYVALTRAKRALYVVIEPVGRSRSRNLPKLLTSALGETFNEGDPLWWQAIAEVSVDGDKVPATGSGLLVERVAPIRRQRLVARTPSGERRATLQGRVWFSRQTEGRAEQGTSTHALLATMDWEAQRDLAAWRLAREKEGRAARQVEWVASLAADPALREVFARPAVGHAELWLERAFEVALEDSWISGSFDRVVVCRDGAGVASSATVFDFKTDEIRDVSDIAMRRVAYLEQIARYRQVIEKITGLPASKVRGAVVFLAVSKVEYLG